MSKTTLWASWILKVFQPSWCQGRGFLENFWTEIHPSNSSATVSAAAKSSPSTLWATQASKVSNEVQIWFLPASSRVFIVALLLMGTTEPRPREFNTEWPLLCRPIQAAPSELGTQQGPSPAAWQTPSPHVLQILCVHFYLKFSFSPSSL